MKLTESGTLVKFRKGETIYKKDFLVNELCVFLIVEGQVELAKSYNALHKDRFLLQKGEVFGMLEVLNGGNRYTSAIAEDDVQAIAFTRVEYEKNLVANLSFALLNIRIMSKLLRELNLRIKQSD
ncbi:MAG: cyclic nucleotide-binding domain-containing protein [Leptospiraceae bacterium]|nr:cyclic nucleotide-binding domain-containing protein [Leptospiraceae bacterium]